MGYKLDIFKLQIQNFGNKICSQESEIKFYSSNRRNSYQCFDKLYALNFYERLCNVIVTSCVNGCNTCLHPKMTGIIHSGSVA